MGIWDIAFDQAKQNFVSGLAYAKSHNLYWHSSGDFYPYPSSAWRLSSVPDPDLFGVDLSFSPELQYNEVKGDLEQLKSEKNVSYPIWDPSSGRYFSASKLQTPRGNDISKATERCRKLFVEGALDLDGYQTCLARVAAEH